MFRVRKLSLGVPPLATLTLVGLLIFFAAGCVQRRMTIRSNPPGATVFVDQVEIGTTPVSHEFIYYGSREIRLVRDGYETLTVLQPTARPWYQFPGIAEFVSENMVPQEIRDEQVFVYQLTPQRSVPTEQLLGRAENLRSGSIRPAAATLPITGSTPSAVRPSVPVLPLPPTEILTPTDRSPRRVWPTP